MKQLPFFLRLILAVLIGTAGLFWLFTNFGEISSAKPRIFGSFFIGAAVILLTPSPKIASVVLSFLIAWLLGHTSISVTNTATFDVFYGLVASTGVGIFFSRFYSPKDDS
jgi:hypothetical protein